MPDQNLQTFDAEFALSQFSGNQELLEKILIKFVEQNHNFAEQLNLSLQNQDMETAKRLVHTLKGVSGNLGMRALHQASKELEQSIGSSINPDELHNFYQLVENAIIIAKNHGVTPPTNSGQSTQLSSVTASASQQSSRDTLILALEREEFLSDDKLNKLINELGLEQASKDQLLELIDSFDYLGAIAMLKR